VENLPVRKRERGLANRLAQAFGCDACPGLCCVTEPHDELLATPAADEIAPPCDALDGRGDPLEDEVAGLVAVGVVDVLEVIDVQEEDRQSMTVPLRAMDLPVHRVAERAPVPEARERVDHCEAARVFHQRDDAQRAAELARQDRQELPVLDRSATLTRAEGNRACGARPNANLGDERLRRPAEEGAIVEQREDLALRLEAEGGPRLGFARHPCLRMRM
jgi:hypothetical protein